MYEWVLCILLHGTTCVCASYCECYCDQIWRMQFSCILTPVSTSRFYCYVYICLMCILLYSHIGVYESHLFYYMVPHVCVRHIMNITVIRYGVYNSHVFSPQCRKVHFTTLCVYVIYIYDIYAHLHDIYTHKHIHHVLVNTTVSTRDIYKSHVFYCMAPHMYSRMTHINFSHPTHPQGAPSNVA